MDSVAVESALPSLRCRTGGRAEEPFDQPRLAGPRGQDHLARGHVPGGVTQAQRDVRGDVGWCRMRWITVGPAGRPGGGWATKTHLACEQGRKVMAVVGYEATLAIARPGYERVPARIVEGYRSLPAEVDAHLGGEPDLVVVPVGVGSLAEAVLRQYRRLDSAHPRVLAVEPDTAVCVLASLTARPSGDAPSGRQPHAQLPPGLMKPGLHGPFRNVVQDGDLYAAEPHHVPQRQCLGQFRP